MMRNKRILIISTALILASFGIASAALVPSIYLGDPANGAELGLAIVMGNNYTFEAYVNLPSDIAEGGIFGSSIDVNYNPAIFSLNGTPTVDTSNFSSFFSSIVAPGDDVGDNVTGNDFGFSASFADPGLSGQIHIGTFSLTALANANIGEWLITTGELGPGDDINNQAGTVFDDTTVFFGATAVPIPSTILLLGGGLAALVAVRRRRS